MRTFVINSINSVFTPGFGTQMGNIDRKCIVCLQKNSHVKCKKNKYVPPHLKVRPHIILSCFGVVCPSLFSSPCLKGKLHSEKHPSTHAKMLKSPTLEFRINGGGEVTNKRGGGGVLKFSKI